MDQSLQSLISRYRFKNISSLILFLGLLFGCFWILKPFLPAILFGMIFTVELYPLFVKICRKVKSKFLASSLIVAVCSFAVIGPFIYVAVRASVTATNLIAAGIQNNPTVMKVTEAVNKVMHDYNLTEYTDQIGSQVLNKVGEYSGLFAQSFLAALPEIGLFTFISLFTIFFGLRFFDRCIKFLRVYSFLPEATFSLVLTTLKKSIHTTIIANIATGALQSVIIAIGVMIATDYDAFLIFILAFVCSFIPIIGAGPVCFAVGVLELISGNNTAGVVLVILSLFVGVADNVARTYFNQGNSEEEPPTFATFLAIIGGVIVFGFPGLFFGPLIVDLFFRLSPTLINEAISENEEP